MIGRELRLLLCAVQFLTRLPIRSIRGFQPDDLNRSARYFPLVGQAVGAVCAANFLAATQVWPGAIPALTAVALGVLITGAFHEDGLADTADGLGGGQTPAQRLEIMRDSRIGTYGVLALGLCLALKVAALSELPPARAALALIAAHGLGRAAAVLAMRLTPYAAAAQGGKWKPAPGGISLAGLLVALAVAAWPLALLGLGGLVATGAGILAAVSLLLLAGRLLGGHTGDVLGAVEQLFETAFFLGLTAMVA